MAAPVSDSQAQSSPDELLLFSEPGLGELLFGARLAPEPTPAKKRTVSEPRAARRKAPEHVGDLFGDAVSPEAESQSELQPLDAMTLTQKEDIKLAYRKLDAEAGTWRVLDRAPEHEPEIESESESDFETQAWHTESESEIAVNTVADEPSLPSEVDHDSPAAADSPVGTTADEEDVETAVTDLNAEAQVTNEDVESIDNATPPQSADEPSADAEEAEHGHLTDEIQAESDSTLDAELNAQLEQQALAGMSTHVEQASSTTDPAKEAGAGMEMRVEPDDTAAAEFGLAETEAGPEVVAEVSGPDNSTDESMSGSSLAVEETASSAPVVSWESATSPAEVSQSHEPQGEPEVFESELESELGSDGSEPPGLAAGGLEHAPADHTVLESNAVAVAVQTVSPQFVSPLERFRASKAAEEQEDPAFAHLPPLPAELKNASRAMLKVFHESQQLPAAFSNFCAAAYVKPEWAGVASEYLAVLFEGREEQLAELTRVPDLIIELGSGHYTLTFMVAFHWAERGDVARLTRLAEALVATHAKLHSPEVVELMLALTTSLAITRYSRAEQLVNAAESHVTPEQQDALADAKLWLAAGSMVRASSPESREIWDTRLRRPRTQWHWNREDELFALSQLAESLDVRSPAARLFKAVVPACWWQLLEIAGRELGELENELAVARAVAGGSAAPRHEPLTTAQAEPAREVVVSRPVVIWRAVPAFVGGLVGAWALLLGILISPYQISRKDSMAAIQEQVSGSPATGVSGSSKSVVPAAGATESSRLEHPSAVWRREQTASLAAESPDLRPYVEKIELGEWPQYEALLKGELPELSRSDPRYQKLLLWLHLDPPSNAEIRRQVPLLLAALRQDTTVIELWQKLVYPGSLNAEEIQTAALRTQHDNAEAWSPTQRYQLTQIAMTDLAQTQKTAAAEATTVLDGNN